jgi:hypothetical protein
MKNKISGVAILLVVLLGLAQCAKDKAPEPDKCNVPTLSYTTNVKPILDAKCATAGCHDAASNTSGFDYSSYNASKAGGDAYICKIKGTCGSIMPPSGKMADSLICILEGWKNQGYPN